MSDAKYNGWTNWETWNTNLHFDDSFTEQAQECYTDAQADGTFSREERAALSLADIIKEQVEESVVPDGKNVFLQDIVSGFLSSVNYYEIAKDYINQVDKEEID